jgi:hypothetical protein
MWSWVPAGPEAKDDCVVAGQHQINVLLCCQDSQELVVSGYP